MLNVERPETVGKLIPLSDWTCSQKVTISAYALVIQSTFYERVLRDSATLQDISRNDTRCLVFSTSPLMEMNGGHALELATEHHHEGLGSGDEKMDRREVLSPHG